MAIAEDGMSLSSFSSQELGNSSLENVGANFDGIIMPQANSAYNGFIAPPNQEPIPVDAIHIQTATELAAIGGEENAGNYYVLANDIDLINEWIPIDDFRGTLDGRGHSINNLHISESSNRQYAGLFGQVNSGTIKNIVVNIGYAGLAASFSGTSMPVYAGGLVGYGSGGVVVENCYVTGDTSAKSSVSVSAGRADANAYVGGLVGYVDGGVVAKNCYVTGDTSAYADAATPTMLSAFANAYVGGLVGYVDGGVVAKNCYVTGDTSAYADAGWRGRSSFHVGGLMGVGSGGVVVENCYVTGDVTGSFSDSTSSGAVGGLIGRTNDFVVVENCYVTGDISGFSVPVGGLIGYSYSYIYNNYGDDVTVDNCFVTGDVTAYAFSSSVSNINTSAGGLIGVTLVRYDVVVENCHFVGDVSGFRAAGGLIGDSSGREVAVGNTVVKCCYVIGDVSEGVVGGIVGSGSSVVVENCHVIGDVTGYGGGGGIVGSGRSVVVECCSVIGDVSGGSTVGGLIGGTGYSGVVKNCYVIGDIFCFGSSDPHYDAVGGLIGVVALSNNVVVMTENCYVIGDISGSRSTTTGIVGSLFGGMIAYGQLVTINIHSTSCYYLSSKTISGDVVNIQGEALTAEQMRQQSSFVGWDFVNVWAIDPSVNDGYPYLRGLVGEQPIITVIVQPVDVFVVAGSIVDSLVFEVSVIPSAVLYYQWYQCLGAISNSETDMLVGTEASFTIPSDLTAGTYYYYCIVSAVGAESVTSNVVTVTVNPSVDVTLDIIEITNWPIKRQYTVNEALDLSGLVVTAVYSDGSTCDITDFCVIEPVKGAVLDTVGTQTVTVSYTEGDVTETDYFEVTVIAKTLELIDIKVTMLPSKLVYTVGEKLDLTGIVVTAQYDDKSVKAIIEYITTPANDAILTDVGTQTVTVSYIENGITKTIDFSITVNPSQIVLKGIEITALPDKTEYLVDEALDLDGLVVTAIYSDGSASDVEVYITEPVDGKVLSNVGSQLVTISYTEGDVTVTNSFVVTVTDATVEYVVHYYLEGTTVSVVADKVVTGQTLGASVTEWAIHIDGYIAVDTATAPTYVTTVLKATDNVFVFYYQTVPAVEYVIHYYLEGTTISVADDFVGSSWLSYYLLQVPKNIAGYTSVSPVLITTLNAFGNEFAFYYTPSTNTAYTVVHYAAVGDGILLSETLTDTTGTVVAAEVTTIIGYTFDATDDRNVLSGVVMSDGSLVLELYYTINQYTITYNLNDGVNAADNPDFYTVDDLPLNIADPTRDGYAFQGWVVEYSDGRPSITVLITSYTIPAETACGITLTAYWVESKPTIISATPTALVNKLNGNTNELIIIITEKLYDGTTNTITQTFNINNNAADTYTVGPYKVYVDTKGNTQIRACHIIT